MMKLTKKQILKKETVIVLLTHIFFSWTTPHIISENGTNSDPFIAANQYGMANVVWTHGDYPDLSALSSFYDGSKWSSPSEISDQGIPICPSCGIDSLGNTMAIYESIDDINRSIILNKKLIGENWQDPVTLSTSSANTSSNLAVNGLGQAVAAFIDNENKTIEALFLNFEKLDSKVTTLSNSTEQKYNLSLGIDDTGNAIAVWEELDSGKILMSTTTDGYGSSWTTPLILSTNEKSTNPSLSLNHLGHALISWTDSESGEIYASIYQDSKWQTAAVLSTKSGSHPKSTATDSNYYVTWTDLDSLDILAAKNNSSNFDKPVVLGEQKEDNAHADSIDPNALFTCWSDDSGQIQAVEYPSNSEPQRPFQISIGDYNCLPKTALSPVSCFSVWESIIGLEHVIQVNINTIK